MSHIVTTLIYNKRVGSMLKKAILLRMADRANDDGSGVWMSKNTIAREIEASRRGVIYAMQQMVEDGLLEEAGRHAKTRTQIYNISLPRVRELPELVSDSANLHPSDPKVQTEQPKVHPVHHIGAPSAPKPSLRPNKPLRACAREEIFEEMIKSGAPVPSVEALSRAVVDYDGGSMSVRSLWEYDRAMQDLEQYLKRAGIKLQVTK